MRTSAAMAKLRPAPMAAPFTAAITGWGQARIFSTMLENRSCPRWMESPLIPSAANPPCRSEASLRSSPEQKPRSPAPVITITRQSCLPCISSQKEFSSSSIAAFTALRRSGRFKVNSPMASSRSNFRVW